MSLFCSIFINLSRLSHQVFLKNKSRFRTKFGNVFAPNIYNLNVFVVQTNISKATVSTRRCLCQKQFRKSSTFKVSIVKSLQLFLSQSNKWIKQRCILDPSGYVNRGFTAVSKRKKKEKILLDPIALKDTVCHPECHYILCLRSAYMNWPTVSEVVSFWHQVLTFSHQVLKKKK